jgi:cytochrome c oxidase subunit 2
MNVDLYERIWMWVAVGIIALFITMTGVSAVSVGIRPPSHVETIDPTAVMADPRFAHAGVTLDSAAKHATAIIVAGTFFFLPDTIRVPAGWPVTFRLTSMDVTHGFEVARTNVNTMIEPGYVSQLTYTFPKPDTFLVVCHEYCGVGHHTMSAHVIVEPAR